MAKVFDAIDDAAGGWIGRQRMFFVGHRAQRRRRPRQRLAQGADRELRILDEHTVAYLDVIGSGAETIAHLRDNGRIVVMLCAFEGPPRILRLHGRGAVLAGRAVEFPGATALPEQQRTVIRVDVERIADSCGYGVPLMAYAGERPQYAGVGGEQAAQGRPARARRVRGARRTP